MFGKKVVNIIDGVKCKTCNDQGQVFEASGAEGERMKPCPVCGELPSLKNTDPKEAEVTMGQYLVGCDFNPGGREDVDYVKRRTAELMDMLHEFMLAQQGEGGNDAAGRCAAVALSKYEEACMWAVKGLTKPAMPV